tara:strand:- start:40 stop:348 length:309 start_codon:yes stop_codon:yes gene_type:complete
MTIEKKKQRVLDAGNAMSDILKRPWNKDTTTEQHKANSKDLDVAMEKLTQARSDYYKALGVDPEPSLADRINAAFLIFNYDEDAEALLDFLTRIINKDKTKH